MRFFRGLQVYSIPYSGNQISLDTGVMPWKPRRNAAADQSLLFIPKRRKQADRNRYAECCHEHQVQCLYSGSEMCVFGVLAFGV